MTNLWSYDIISLMIPRFYDDLGKLIERGRVLVIYGPRRVGKTTILKNFLQKTNLKYKLDIGEDIRVQQVLSSQDFSQILPYAQGYELIVIDEAQQIPNIGMGLKIIVDQLPDVKVIATGSSSFDLSHQVGEPLTGRKRTLILYPIAQLELAKLHTQYELKRDLENFLIFGSYPQVITAKSKQKKIEILSELVSSYLLKDILSLEKVKGSKILLDLLKLLSFQVGSEVSLNELSRNLNIDVKTVARYLDLLEKTFVIFRLGGFRRNLRSEITQKSKYYFLDNGIRNGVILQFNDLDLRDDVGKLWENFLVSERLKKQQYMPIFANNYFWRTHDQKEIDLIEEREGKLFGFEFKYSKDKTKIPKEFLQTYPNSQVNIINQENYLDFVLKIS